MHGHCLASIRLCCVRLIASAVVAAALVASVLAAAALAGAGCQRTRILQPAYLDDLRVESTPLGPQVSLVFLDSLRRPTVVMFGAGVIRIEDAPDDTAELPREGPLDTTRIVYNSTIVLSREYFVRREVMTSARIETTEVCDLGVFPYRQFLRRPTQRDGIVRVAFIPPGGRRVMQISRRFAWPPEAFEPPG